MPRITIEKLVFGGQGMGRMGNKVAFIWGALPEDEVEFSIIKAKKNFIEGVVTKVIKPSPYRISQTEEHYLCCSPWQTLSWEEENSWKKKIALETYRRIGKLEVPEDTAMINGADQFHYRNKIEYSFTVNRTGKISLAFFERNQHQLHAIEKCDLAMQSINQTAIKILDWLNKENVPLAALKSLIVRGNRKGETSAALFVKQKWLAKVYPKLTSEWLGFQIYFSNPFSPAATPDELLYNEGKNYLIETVGNIKFKYGLLSFFQINIPVFEQAIQDIDPYIKDTNQLLDYYSGVGSISLHFHKKAKSVTLIENNNEAVEYANENIQINAIENAKASLSSATDMVDQIKPGATVIVDPPRAGLDPSLVAALLQNKPSRLVYLSCDLATHSRDVAALSSVFKPIFWRWYNFFPRTPHLEGLCILERHPSSY